MKNSTQILHIALTEPYCIKGLTVISTPTTGIISLLANAVKSTFLTLCKKRFYLSPIGFLQKNRVYSPCHKQGEVWQGV